MLIVVIILPLQLPREPVPVSGFPVLVIGVRRVKWPVKLETVSSSEMLTTTHITMQCQNQGLQTEQSPTMKT